MTATHYTNGWNDNRAYPISLVTMKASHADAILGAISSDFVWAQIFVQNKWSPPQRVRKDRIQTVK